MPASSVNSGPSQAQSQGSVGSSASKRSKVGNYKTVAKVSAVEESLFGEANHVKERDAMLQDKRRNRDCKDDVEIFVTTSDPAGHGCRGKVQSNPRETIRVISSDLIRDLTVADDPKTKTIVLPSTEYMRLKARSKVLSKDELNDEEERIKRMKDEEMEASQDRKQYMKQMDIKRQRNEKLTDLEEEARKMAQVLLQKAMEQRQEQEDEIKTMNELILNAKIQAIRDAQILEKGQVHKELAEEERRLDEMMEIERQNAIQIQEEIEKLRHEEELIGACSIMKQIEENEQERLLELERKDQENIATRKYIAQVMEEEYKKRLEHRHQQDIHREELNKANDIMISRRSKEKELDMLNDLKILEIQREKAEREAAYEAEQVRIKSEKEREIARMRALQERAKDEQAERDALRAKRASEAAEREWRRKEAEEARKKGETEAELKMARAAQSDQKKHFLAIQAARDRAEFEKILGVQKELVEQDKQEQDRVHGRRVVYASEIRRQIRDKEQEKIAERNAFFEEGVRMEEEARLRRMRLEEAKARKLKELRSAGIPEKYLAQVERKINTVHQAV